MTASLTFNPFQQKFRSNVLILGTIKQLQLKNNVNLEKVQVLNSLSAPLFKNNFLNSFQQQHGDSLITLAKLKAEKTRNGYLMRTDLVKEILEKFAPASLTELDIIFLLDSEVQALTAVQAICTHFSLYDRTTSPKDAAKSVNVSFITLDESVVDYEKLRVLSQGIRLAARLTDMPASELNTQTYVEEVNAVYKDLVSKGFKNLNLEVIKGEELKAKGLGGIYGVGKAAEFPPALAILSFKPENAKRTMAWVGKGIVYDTGGLSIKVPPNMCTMKHDMGGSAAVLGAFQSYVLLSKSEEKPLNLYALLCMADNAISSKSQRPDDIVDMYSGKTVELNNTDAEGRLVLADGVAYATKHFAPDVVLDIATLTGAVLVTTGKKHAGILCNDIDLENTLVNSGRNTGNLVFPLLYAPELLMEGPAKQFGSTFADMKNSVKDRANAQSSCAGHFIESHLVGDKWDWKKLAADEFEGKKGLWGHIDCAGTATAGEKSTGYGVSLLYDVAKTLSFSK